MNKVEMLNHYIYKHQSDPKFSKGTSLLKHIPYLTRVMHEHRVKSILDYGCGKAIWWDSLFWRPVMEAHRVTVQRYDPAIEKFQDLPDTRYDLVICSDVLEHLHPEDTEEVVKKLVWYTRRHLFCGISLVPAKKRFKDGTNFHTNLHTKEWWEELFLRTVNDYEKETNSYISYKLSFNDEVHF